MRSVYSAFLLLGSLAVHPPASALAANIDSNLAVSAATQAGGGGCYPVSISPSVLDMLTLINPEWAAVDVGVNAPPISDPVTVHGSVARAKINDTGDIGIDHVNFDQNTFIDVDAADMGLVATGNVGPHGVELGSMEVEWETGKYPLFAWGGTGDRFTAVGRWIWDCGHPGADPGTCSTTTTQACIINRDCRKPTCPTCVTGETCVGVNFGYHSELHAPRAVAISRMGGYGYSKRVRAGRLVTRTDVWISGDGGGAGDICAVTHLASSLSVLTTDCYPFSQPLADINTSNFEFDIPLPPRPAGNTSPPRIRVKDQTPTGLPRAPVTTTFIDGPTPIVHAVVDTTTPIHGRLPTQVGKTITAGWRPDRTPITRLRVDVTAFEITNPLKAVNPVLPARQVCSVTTTQDCSMSACPAGETCLTIGGPTPGWKVFLEANGQWRDVAGLENIAAPAVVPQTISYDVGIPDGGTLHLHASGKSLGCLESQLYGQSGERDVALYGLTDGATCLADTSKVIGDFDLNLTGPDYGSGGQSMTYVTPSVGGDGGACSTTTSQLCLTDADCPMGETCAVTGASFALHYTITKVQRLS